METTEATPKTKIAKTSFHHFYDVYQSATRSLDFYKEELQYLQKRLADIVSANTKQEVLSTAEHFQNQFLIVGENIADLKSRVSRSLEHIEQQIKLKPMHTDERSIDDLGIYNRDLHDIEKNFATMKMEFNVFLSKYM
jgi:hypothetical protein